MASMAFISADRLIQLLQSAAGGDHPVVRIVDGHRLAVGNDPFGPTHYIDFAGERLVAADMRPGGNTNTESATRTRPTPAPVEKARRRTGKYSFVLRGVRKDTWSLRELLKGALLALQEANPGTFETLSSYKPRSKRIVSKNPAALFEQAHLVEKYAEELGGGWWFGTNNSAPETREWLRRACDCAGLTWGVDFDVEISESSSQSRNNDLDVGAIFEKLKSLQNRQPT